MLYFIYITVFEHLHEDTRAILYDKLWVDGVEFHNELEYLFSLDTLKELLRGTHIDEWGDSMFIALRHHVLLLLDIREQVLGYLGAVDVFMVLGVVYDIG